MPEIGNKRASGGRHYVVRCYAIDGERGPGVKRTCYKTESAAITAAKRRKTRWPGCTFVVYHEPPVMDGATPTAFGIWSSASGELDGAPADPTKPILDDRTGKDWVIKLNTFLVALDRATGFTEIASNPGESVEIIRRDEGWALVCRELSTAPTFIATDEDSERFTAILHDDSVGDTDRFVARRVAAAYEEWAGRKDRGRIEEPGRRP